MKNIKIILNTALLFVTINLYSQSFPVLSTTNQAFTTTDDNYWETGNYAIDSGNIRNQLVGTWRYQTSGILLEMKIEKRDKELYRTPNTYRFLDIIIIKYKLVKNGVVIHDNLNATIPVNNTGYHNYDLNFISYGFYNKNTYEFRGFMNDYYRQVLCDYTMQKTSVNGQDKLLLNISNGNYRIYGDDSMYTASQKLFSLPLGPILLDKLP